MTDAVADATTPPYEQWTVRELRDELRARSLPTSGSQSELAARLTDADELAERLTVTDREPADLTVPELKDELRERDQPVSGTKDELVQRLEAADDTAADSDDTPTDRLGRPACVVDDGTAHTGRATPGAKICSAHAMHYKADGTSRAEAAQADAARAEELRAESVQAEQRSAEDVKRDE